MNAVEPLISSLPSPSAIIKGLDARVVGQQAAKRKLAVAAHLNLKRRRLLGAGVDRRRLVPNQNVLLAGPTGSGKTLLARALGEILDCPFFSTTATSYCAAGYRGLQVDSMVDGLIHAAGGDKERAKSGIILVDEVDKLRRRDFGGRDDVGAEAVQQALLTLLDGGSAFVGPYRDEPLETDGIMFIAAGLFSGLGDTDGDFRAGHVPGEELVQFGLTPEFVGRFTVREKLGPLTSTELREILSRGILDQMTYSFELHGVSLEIDEGALDAIVSLAEAEATGARALAEVVFDRLPLAELLADLTGVARVIVDRETILDGKPPWKVPGDSKSRVGCAPSGSAASEKAFVGLSDCRGWTPDRIRRRLEEVKAAIGYLDAGGNPDHNWQQFESENRLRLDYVLRVAEEIASRNTTIDEFFSMINGSGVGSMDANLSFFDYRRVLQAEQKEKQEKWEERSARARARYGPK